ncbi:MAG TPA: hypothetical protein VEC37_09255, partial [Bacillota bacterium]|nr:hypothetical protein [Bacillota bacterium]
IPDIFIMSKRVYDSLPAATKKIVVQAAKDSMVMQRKIWSDLIDDNVKQLKAKGMEFNEVNNLKEFQALVKPIYKEFEPVVGKKLIDAVINAQ